MKKTILIGLAFILTIHLHAQHEADNWRFGVLSGIDFSSGTPVSVSGAIYTNEGCAAISDASGNLLFYTDGINVWNNQDLVMPNGSGLMGGITTTQSALIVPLPGSATHYYIFTVDEFGGPNGFRYSIVDMSLQGGLGDVTSSKNVFILNNVTEKLTGVNDQAGNFWIAVHEWGSDAFYVYNLTSSGISLPVISHIGMVHNTTQIQNTYGQMKYSSCGNKLALANGYLDTVQVFEFNNVTGLVKTPITIPFTDHVYGIEFSDNGQLLYVTTYNPFATLLQFDLSSGIEDTIVNSQTILSSTPDIYALQMGPDNRIYAARSWSQFLGVINSPSIIGLGCNYIDNGFDLDPNFMGYTSALGLPGFIQSTFRNEAACIATGIAENSNHNSATFFPNPFTDRFTIQIIDNISTNINIYDETGRLLEQFNKMSMNFTYGEFLEPGVYFISTSNLFQKKINKIIKIKN